MEEPYMHTVSKRSHSEKVAYCMIPAVWVQPYDILKAQPMEIVKWTVGVREWVEGNAKSEHRRLLGHCLFFVIQWIYIFIHLPQTTEYLLPRMNPDVHCGLWVIVVCQHRFVSSNQCTFVVHEINRFGSERGNIWGMSILFT